MYLAILINLEPLIRRVVHWLFTGMFRVELFKFKIRADSWF